MTLNRVLLAALLLLTLAIITQAVYWWPALPERMASHFDMSNRADGWMDRGPLLIVMSGVPLFMVALFVGLPLVIRRLPDSMINMPNKEYWLAPARREQSLADMNAALMAIGCATLVLLLVIYHGIFSLNAKLALAGEPLERDAHIVLPLPFVVVLGLYLLSVAAMLVWMLGRFKNPS
jgi:uncharacterized membrane protein